MVVRSYCDKIICVTSPEKACDAFSRYGVDAIMVGRVTFGCPWIFKDIRDALVGDGSKRCTPAVVGDGSKRFTPLTTDEKLDILEELLRINVERIDEQRGILHTRRHLAATPLFKGISNFRPTRIAMLRATRMDELLAILEETRLIIH